MTNWTDYIARVAVRRIVVVLVMLALAWIGVGRAEASCNSQSGQCSTIEEAWARASSDKATFQTNDQNNGLPNYNYRITGSGTQASPFRVQHCTQSQYVDCGNEANWSTDTAYWSYTGCTAPAVFSTTSGTCQVPCDQRADTNFNYPTLLPGDTTCHDGCEFVVYAQSGGFASQAASGTSCTTTPDCLSGYTAMTSGGIAICRPTDTDGDGTPDIDDDFPNDPGETGDSDGDGVGDNGDSAPDDPTNGGDTPGDADGDDEGDNTSFGGGNCATPPESHGDGILAQIAYQTWKTRCEQEEGNDHALAIIEAIEAQGPNGGGSATDMGPTNSKLDGIKATADSTLEYLKDGEGDDGGAGPALPEEEAGEGGMKSWDSGLGGGGVCPAPAVTTITFLEYSKELSFDFGPMCSFADYIHNLMLVLGALMTAIIVSGVRRA